MLVVDSIVPGSYAEKLLEPGDVVVKVKGRVLTHFLTLEDILDSAVGGTVTLDVERDGQPIHAAVQVSVHNVSLSLSYCQAFICSDNRAAWLLAQ